MAEEAEAQEVQAEQPEADNAADWEAKYKAMREHSREWERKAKENQGAADELEKLKADQLSEQEKANRRADEAEAELSRLKAEAEHSRTVSEVAERNGVPAEFVKMLTGEDGEALTAQVKRALEILRMYPTREDDGGSQAKAKKTNVDLFGEAFGI